MTVGGGSQAPVNVTSSSSALVEEQAASAAVSGQAWAVAAGAPGSPSGVATPAVAGAAPTSVDISQTALETKNNLSNTSQNTATSSGGPANTAPILITPDQVMSVHARGIVAATSSAACAGAGCQAPNSTPPGTTQAASGAATAQGLVAENVVNTNATVAVHVAGRNFSPISIIVDSVTRIFNLGIGSSQSGDATAGGVQGAALAAGQTARSGAVQTTGAQVENTVDLRSTATVRVSGDNYSPIQVLLNLATTLFNRGMATATSGDAQTSSGGGSGSAFSGWASATGLQVMNIVNMWAEASVDVEGNNYAPIVIEIHFNTNIDNRGIGVATSGNVAAGQAGTQGAHNSATGAATPGTSASNSATAGSATQSSRARGGNATAISNSVDAAFNSSQLSSANGGKAISSTTILQMLRTLPTGAWNPFAQSDPLPPTSGSVVQAGVDSSSGDTRSAGLHATDVETNAQLAACSVAGTACTAVNSASMAAAMKDSASNPAVGDNQPKGSGGGPSATSGDALVNATPTPTPLPRTESISTVSTGAARPGPQPGGGSRTASRGTTRYVQFSGQTVAADLTPGGHLVLVDPWDDWPGRRLPPMPNLAAHKPLSTTVDVSLSAWPGTDELPLPELTANSAPGEGIPAAARAPVRLARGAGALQDVPVESEDGPLDVLAIVDVDPFGGWPVAQPLPLPGQVVVAAVTSQQQQQQQEQDPAPADGTPASGGGVPMEDVVAAALLAIVGASVGASRRGRQFLVEIRLRLRGLFAGWPAPFNLRPW